MDFNWFFKGFKNNPRNVFLDEDNFEGDSELRDEATRDSPTIDPFENFETASLDIFQHMDAMLNRIFSGNFASFGSENVFENVPSSNNPRSIMLKEPGCENCKPVIELEPFEGNKRSLMIDSDIDEKVAKHGLLIDENTKNKMMHNFSFKRSFKSVHLRDGTMEEHQTFTDSDGNTTTTVRRVIGDQSYEITTHSDTQGLKEKKENLTNLDQSELPNFEKQWQNVRAGSKQMPIFDIQPKEHIPILNPPPGDASYSSLFKKFFGF